MSQQQLLNTVAAALDAAGIDYMITGSVAASLLGQPRSTHDIDLVVAVDERSAEALLRAFPPPGYLLDRPAVLSAVRRKSVFSLMDTRTGDKVDFWPLTSEPFDQARFARKQEQDVLGTTMKVTAPGDLILKKLVWAKQCGGSEKQFKDALSVYEVQRDVLDEQDLDAWARRLNVEDLWRRVKEEAEPIQGP